MSIIPSTNLNTFILIPTDNYSLYHSSRKLLFASDRNHYRKQQPIKLQSCRVQFQRMHPQNTLTSKAQRVLQKKGQKI